MRTLKIFFAALICAAFGYSETTNTPWRPMADGDGNPKGLIRRGPVVRTEIAQNQTDPITEPVRQPAADDPAQAPKDGSSGCTEPVYVQPRVSAVDEKGRPKDNFGSYTMIRVFNTTNSKIMVGDAPGPIIKDLCPGGSAPAYYPTKKTGVILWARKESGEYVWSPMISLEKKRWINWDVESNCVSDSQTGRQFCKSEEAPMSGNQQQYPSGQGMPCPQGYSCVPNQAGAVPGGIPAGPPALANLSGPYPFGPFGPNVVEPQKQAAECLGYKNPGSAYVANSMGTIFAPANYNSCGYYAPPYFNPRWYYGGYGYGGYPGYGYGYPYGYGGYGGYGIYAPRGLHGAIGGTLTFGF